MKEGDLVKFVGHANFYKGRLGVVCRLYSTHGNGIRKTGARPPNSALVYFAGAENQGRAEPMKGTRKSGLHPMALDELEVVDR